MANYKRESILNGKLGWLGDNLLSDAGVYKEAAQSGKSLSYYLENLKAEKEETPYINLTKPEIWAEKAKIQKETGRKAPLTAFEECLKAAGIRAFGQQTDPVAKFYEYSDTEVLFPEYVADRVYAGMLTASLVPELVMMTSVIDSTTFHKTYLEDTEEDRRLGEVGKGEEFGETKIIVARESIYLTKYGRYLTVAYEDIEFVRLNVFDFALQRIGQQIGIDQTDELVYVLINGDGNSNTPGTTVSADTSGTIALADIIEYVTCLPTPYKMTDMIGRKALNAEWYTTLAGLYNPLNSYGIPAISLPRHHEWDRTTLTSDYFMGIDKNYAIEHITTGAVLTEAEKIIRKQINGTAISHRDAFAIFDENAVAIFDETA